MFNAYAEELQQIQPSREEYVTIRNPKVTVTETFSIEKKCFVEEYEVIVGYNNLDHKLDFESRIYVTKENPANIKSKEIVTSDLVSTIEMRPKQTPQRDVIKKSYTYTILKDCTEYFNNRNNIKYNVWAVITKISKVPFQTRGTKKMAQIYIQDPESDGTFGYKDYQLSLLADTFDEFPQLSIHSVVRVHNMAVQDYMGMYAHSVCKEN